jgi:hypothetical protein
MHLLFMRTHWHFLIFSFPLWKTHKHTFTCFFLTISSLSPEYLLPFLCLQILYKFLYYIVFTSFLSIQTSTSGMLMYLIIHVYCFHLWQCLRFYSILIYLFKRILPQSLMLNHLKFSFLEVPKLKKFILCAVWVYKNSLCHT